MASREKLSDESLTTVLSTRSGWSASASAGAPAAIEKTFSFKDYPSGVAFVVRVGFAAEKRDHHPDIYLGWGKVRVGWSTHDAGGVTEVDVEMADVTERIYAAG
jgi:4a-hydroxytetrahydrobiopterin dehydratase